MGMRHIHLVAKDEQVVGWTHHHQIQGYELRRCTFEQTKNLPELKYGEDGLYAVGGCHDPIDFEDYTDDKGEVEGELDTRPAWAVRLQGYTCNWSQIDQITKTCRTAGVELTDESVVTLKSVTLEMERRYLVTVFVDGKEIGKYSY